MNKKIYYKVTGSIFLIITAVHAWRIFAGWEVFIGGWEAPQWISWAAVGIAGFLAHSSFTLGKRK